jgi:Family of unknown function (DUF6390)
MSDAGALLFAQYAYPPNELGYCGPPGAEEMLRPEAVAELEGRARRFDGAWCYLEALATATGTADPLDAEVVEAYWVGNELLDQVDPGALVAHLERRFAGQLGGSWRGAARRAVAHHSFHVFEVYPWAELLKAGRPSGPAVQVLDDCRIRVGQVLEGRGESVLVANRRLTWDGGRLHQGPETQEPVRWSVDGQAMIAAPQPGDLVALHWDWVCAVVTPAQVARIASAEERQRAAVGLG